MNRFQFRDALGQMLLPALNPRSRIVSPSIVLSGISDLRRYVRVLFHPSFPVRFEIRAKLAGLFGLRVSARASSGVTQNYHRHNQQRATQPHGSHRKHSHHAFPLAATKSFSRSRASITINRAVSSTSIAVLSTITASSARTNG